MYLSLKKSCKMKMSIERRTGIALLLGSCLTFATMVLHPSGGNLQHLLKSANVIVISHSFALLAIPFLSVGFWGLTKKMGVDHFLPPIAFAMVLMGLLAGMIAAIINGLALPIYIQNYQEATIETTTSIKPILRNNIALNQAFDFVFLGAVSLSIFLWSIAILTLKKLPMWIGYFGLCLSVTAIGMMATGFVFVNLHGFRIFVFSNVIWISLIGIALMRLKEDTN